MREGAKTSTSLVSYQKAKDYFEKLLIKGKDILHISFASACSGTYDNIRRVADEINQRNANKILVVDSMCESLGQGLLVELVCNKATTGASVSECFEYANQIRHKIVHLFTVDNLKYLASGGRISKASAFVGNVLSVKPILNVDETGRLVPKTKVITRKISLVRLIEKTKAKFNGEYAKIYIGHSDCEEDAKFIADKLTSSLKVQVELGEIGPVIGAHSGPGTIAIFFIGNDRAYETAKEESAKSQLLA